MYDTGALCRKRSSGEIGEVNRTFRVTLPPTSNSKIERVDVYAKEVWVATSGRGFGLPIQVYVVLSTRIRPVHPVDSPLCACQFSFRGLLLPNHSLPKNWPLAC